MDVIVRDCGGDDLDVMAQMAEARRVNYERFEPLFWSHFDRLLGGGR